jgi:hemerythrin-like domain-containing protein
MTVLSSLIEEHRLISRLIGALEVYSRRVGHGVDVDPAHLRGFVTALTELGDHLHHEKEERILLPFLSRHGFDWNAEPLPLIRQEHRHELYLLGVLRQAGERLVEWSAEERRHVAAAAAALCEFQRRHHQTENEQLFPVAEQRLSPSASLQLERELEAFDAVPAHRQRRAAALPLATRLIEQYIPNEVLPSEAGREMAGRAPDSAWVAGVRR